MHLIDVWIAFFYVFLCDPLLRLIYLLDIFLHSYLTSFLVISSCETFYLDHQVIPVFCLILSLKIVSSISV